MCLSCVLKPKIGLKTITDKYCTSDEDLIQLSVEMQRLLVDFADVTRDDTRFYTESQS